MALMIYQSAHLMMQNKILYKIHMHVAHCHALHMCVTQYLLVCNALQGHIKPVFEGLPLYNMLHPLLQEDISLMCYCYIHTSQFIMK